MGLFGGGERVFNASVGADISEPVRGPGQVAKCRKRQG